MPRRPRVFAGGLSTETNSFSPLPTGYLDFRRAPPYAPQDARDRIFFGRSFRSYARVAEARQLSLRIGTYANAVPAGPTPRSVYLRLRDELLDELRAQLPVDGVLLTLHGAMTCDGVADCETDIIQRVREVVGDAARIGVLLDLHCDVPRELTEAADVVVIVREYPHIDVEPRAHRMAEVVARAIAGEVSPVMGRFECRVVGLFPTVREPMRTFVDGTLTSAEKDPAVLAASLGHGFPYLDAVYPGACALVVADGDQVVAQTTAERIGEAFYGLRHKAAILTVPLAAALDDVLTNERSGTIVLADVADNPGGGAPGDSTFALAELLRRGVRNVGLAPLWDPGAVRAAFAAEVGAMIRVRLGGKATRDSGEPVDASVRVKGLCRDLVQRWPQADGVFSEMTVGDAACLDVAGIDVIVASERDQAFGVELFTAFGIDPATKRLLVLKSANHFRAAYDGIASEVRYIDAGGALPGDPRLVPYTNFERRAYPWVDDPFHEPPRPALTDGAQVPASPSTRYI